MKQITKTKTISVLLCLSILLTFFSPLSEAVFANATETDGKITITTGNTAAITLDGNTTISASTELTEVLRWQIYSAEYDIWVNINGETGTDCVLTYAKVYNMLDDNNQTKVRCVSDSAESSEVEVEVDYSQTQTANQSTSKTTIAAKAAAQQFSLSGRSTNYAVAANNIATTYNIVINYVFENGEVAASPYTANVGAGTDFSATVENPTVQGYLPYVDENTETSVSVELNYTNIEQDYTITVTYKPTLVNYTVIHYQQNADDDEYTEVLRETLQGLTKSTVPEVEKNYDGFKALLYEQPAIAADGSTIVEIYYDRLYYLVNFSLDGGYGVEPIYARHGSPISVGTPTKAGYSFEGWTPALPATVPIGGGTYTATWKAGSVSFNVVFWYENADDTDYSYAGYATIKNITPGTTVSSADYKNTSFEDRDDQHFTYNANKTESKTVSGDGSTVLNVYFTRNTYTLTFKTQSSTVATITAKYNAYIANKFPISGYEGRAWKATSYYSYALQTLDRMPDKNVTFNLYQKSSNTLKTIHYYVEKVDGSGYELLKDVTTYFNYITYEEEYHPIQGFERQSASAAGFKSNKKNFTNNEVSLYYTRNSYTLNFYNYNQMVSGKGGSVKYQAPLSSYNFIPDLPSGLEKGAYEFAGWYTSPGCYEGSEVNWDTITMPASDLTVYAKWVPVKHTVEIYKDSTLTEQLGETLIVPHGSKVQQSDIPEEPTNGDYKFVYWFYMDNGVEKAFDFENMPVNKDLKIYAKWSSNILKPYIIYYKLQDGTSIGETDVWVSDVTEGSALVGTTRTFDAKGGDELYPQFQEGYFPLVKSHSFTIDVNGENEYTFIYTQKDAVPYTVKYLNKETGEPVADEKTVSDNRKAVVTEVFKQVDGMMPDAYQKRLVVSAEEGAVNEIIFYYTEDTEHAYYKISHYTENVGGGWTERSSTEAVGNIGTEYSASPITIPGFTYDSTVEGTLISGELTASGLHLKLYYTRNRYPYQVRYLEYGSGKALADPKNSTAKYGEVIYENAILIDNYDCVSSTTQTITIRIESGDNAQLNIITFYYKEKQATINYVAVGPDGATNFGSVNPSSETVNVISGHAQGSTPVAAEDFRFVGWYTDATCTVAVTDADGTVDGNNHFTPAKQNGKYVSDTYYAKFEYNLTQLTIHKTGAADIDKNQTFIFHITGDSANDRTKDIDLKVVIKGNGSATLKDLPVGNYTITEESGWSWRYTPDQLTKEIEATGTGTNEITFKNTRSYDNWLNNSAYAKNDFAKKSN